MSFRPMVKVSGESKFVGNALRFATREEAESHVHDLMMRWFAVEDTRVEESDEPVNYVYREHKLEPKEDNADVR